MEFSSRPHAVTVYRAGALVERRIVIEAPTTGRVVLPGLPLSLIDDSVSVRVTDPDRATVGSATVRLHARPRSDAPEAPGHGALREARQELEVLQRRRAHLDAELSLLTAIPMPSRPEAVAGQPPPPSPLNARIALDGFLDTEVRQRHEQLLDLQASIREQQRLVADLQDQIRRHQGAKATRPDELSKSVHLDLHVPGTGPIELRLAYRVPACRWVPRYALHLRGDQATLELRASVAQASGEDWTGVHLTLSTADPQAYCPLPRLPAARIGKAQPAPPRKPPRPPPEGARALFDDVDRALRDLPRPAGLPSRRAHATTLSSVEDVFEDAALHDAFDTLMVGASAAAELDDMEEAYAEAPEPAPAPPPQRTMAAPMPKSAPAGRSAKRKKKARRRDEAPAEAAQAASAWPDYGTLVLPDPFGPSRGRLAPMSTQDRLAEVLSDAGLHVPFDVGALLSQHADRARRVSRLAVPRGAEALRPSHFDHAVRASHAVDVPSLGSWHAVALGEHTAQCDVRYIGVPREEAAMYRIATMANPCGHPLLPGPVEVYVAGTYVLTAPLPTTGSGEPLELGVGVEPSLHVARNTTFEEARSDERVVAMRELHHRIAIELRNDLDRPVDLEVRERVPVPEGEAEVAIDVVDTSPAWMPYDQKERSAPLQGGHRWRIQLDARSSTTLNAHYVLRLYANNEVVGGDRREA